jgi:hypothetical protein
MSRTSRLARVALAGLLSLGATGTAQALSQDITAEFIPDPANPTKNEFRNTTPVTGICAGHMPIRCQQMGIFTIRTSNFAANANAPIEAFHEDPRQGAMWKVPSEWRDVQVTHARTGETETVQVRIAGIGHRWDVRPNTSAWARPGYSWQGQWSTAPSPCQSTGFLTGNNTLALFFWLVPEGAGVCSRFPGTTITRFWYSTFEFAYALRTPNPLGMSSGEYVGNITYTMGPHQDFDFGDVVIPSDNQLTLNFSLDVLHTLQIDSAYRQVLELGEGDGLVNRMLLDPHWRGWLEQRYPERHAQHQQRLKTRHGQLYELQDLHEQWRRAPTPEALQQMQDLATLLGITDGQLQGDDAAFQAACERLEETLGYDALAWMREQTRNALRDAGDWRNRAPKR